jgi:putrescine importer
VVKTESQKLGLWQNIILGLAFMEPALSLLATFSLVLVAGYSWAATPLAYLIAGFASIITAVSFAELVRAHPKGGSIWAFGTSTVGPRFGQFSVWVYLLEILVVPAATLIPVGFFAYDWLGIPPWITVLVCVLVVLGLTTRGTTLSFRTAAVLLATELIILFVFAVSSILWAINLGTFETMAVPAITPSGSLLGLAGIMVGATVAIFSYIGYESPANMVEETQSPAKNIPRAIIISAVVGTIIYTFLAWSFVLAIPSKGLFSLLYYINPVPSMAAVIWGSQWRGVIDLVGMIGGFTAALAGVTAGSRLLQKLGEDKVIPTAFKKTTAKYATPMFAVLFIGLISLILGQFTPWEVMAYTIAAGAIPTFIITNFLAFWKYIKSGYGPKNIIIHGVLPWIGIALCSWFAIVGLQVHMKMLLLLWVALGIFFVAINACFRPHVFSKGGTKERVEQKTGRISWLSLGLSIALLIIVAVGFNYWFTFFSGGIQWWYVVAPYAFGDLTAIAVVVVCAVILIGLMWFTLFRKKGEVVNK